MSDSCPDAAVAHLQFIDGDPGVGREALQHWHEELQTTAPVADEEHHANQVEDPHEHRGHVEELQRVVAGKRATHTTGRERERDRHEFVIILAGGFRGRKQSKGQIL